MKLLPLSNLQLEASAYVFEMANGNDLQDFRREVVTTSQLPDINPDQLAQHIVHGIEVDDYMDPNTRGTAYWALSKRFDTTLIPLFRKWLKKELELQNFGGMFQLMIALSNVDEPIFDSQRTGYASFEQDLNERDAHAYLKRHRF
ncbi:MAG: hypothetical protein AAF466_14350 [Bacteroidota bacterium]